MLLSDEYASGVVGVEVIEAVPGPDREARRVDADGLGREEVSQLVHEDHEPEHEDRREDG